MSTKVELTIAVKKGWSSSWSESVAIEVDGDITYETMLDALHAIKKMSEDRQFLSVSTRRAVDMYTGLIKSEAKAEGVKEGKGKADEMYKVQNELNKANEQLAEKECQIKGLIKSFDEHVLSKSKE